MNAHRKLWHAAKFALVVSTFIAACDASAALSCSTVTITAISTAYDPTVATDNDSAGSFTATCTRTATTDANPVTYYLGANNGANFSGTSRRGRLGATANRYNYGLSRDSGFTSMWGDTSNAGDRIAVTFNFPATVPSTVTVSGVFYMRVPGSQAAGAAGNYTDSVSVQLRNPPGANPTATLAINVHTQTFCTITVPPGNVNFTYTSLQAAASNASTLYGVRCTTSTPYTMALDATSGTLLGLNYTLGLSASSATGSGVTQTYSINGSIAGG
ncbi:MAG TPA: spore coat protein U domain-containing protein, partial [Burkholderiales bacterium]|nr:spore coat protein U domain-containing protein [Burkholderiales bacterium]